MASLSSLDSSGPAPDPTQERRQAQGRLNWRLMSALAFNCILWAGVVTAVRTVL